ncbi:VWA domain-containing protein [Tunturiibacter gelidoferens]|uniref:VWFA-related protein n=1 Tax=Tunturiibacter lichenicola TaxID=2051959 RepID=A0A7Y9NQW2_9BACT|nr:VWA domain-containing protein [Edaphobacter lichenicola]NYF53871.1 VWFA-related protein [Edaphobacter lichenicola]
MNQVSSLKLPVFLLSLILAATPLNAQTDSGPSPATNPAPSAQPPATPAPTASQQPAATPSQAPAQSGQASPQIDEPVTTLQVQVNEVNLIFTVIDKHGKFITGLKRENFGLLDDGRPPTAVLRFTQQTNLPLRVGIMLDTSSSIRQRFQFEQDSAIEFLLQILHLNDRAFVEGFDIETDVAQDFTNNVDLLNQGIRKLRPGGGTALFDALYKTCKDQMLPLQETGAVRRALILVSDGDDNYSRVQESDAIKMCQRADTIVYTISTNISPSKDKGDDVLKAISDATGGQAFYPVKLEDVAIGFRNIEEELRSQYHLVYRPADLRMDGSFRTIYLQANDPRFKVRAQKGYFSPRPPQ